MAFPPPPPPPPPTTTRLASRLLACIQVVPEAMLKLRQVSSTDTTSVIVDKVQHLGSCVALGCVNALVAVAGWVVQDCARYNAFAERQLQEDEEMLCNEHDAR